MDRLQSMRVFQRVIDEGGFAAAARALDMSPAVVTDWWPIWKNTWGHVWSTVRRGKSP